MLFTEEDIQAVRDTILKDDRSGTRPEILDAISEVCNFSFVKEMAARSLLADLMSTDNPVLTRQTDIVTALCLGFFIGKRKAEIEQLEKLNR